MLYYLVSPSQAAYAYEIFLNVEGAADITVLSYHGVFFIKLLIKVSIKV